MATARPQQVAAAGPIMDACTGAPLDQGRALRRHLRSRRLGFIAVAAPLGIVACSAFVSLPGSALRSERSASAPRTRRTASVADPVNNVAPEVCAEGQKWARKLEDIYERGTKLWNYLKKETSGVGKPVYVVGPPSPILGEVAQSLADILGYLPAEDGTLFMNRRPDGVYPEMQSEFQFSDQLVSKKTPLLLNELFMEDEAKFYDLESEVIKEFSESDFGGYPAVLAVGEGAVLREENLEIMKKGIIVYVSMDPSSSWGLIHRKSGHFMIGKPPYMTPPWVALNGWDEDVDDFEAKEEYMEILKSRIEIYEQVADVTIRGTAPDVQENPALGADKALKQLIEEWGLDEEEEMANAVGVSFAEELQQIMAEARLDKYMKVALEWCDEQGAATLEDIAENVDDFADALQLKPLERKRLAKVASRVEVS